MREESWQLTRHATYLELTNQDLSGQTIAMDCMDVMKWHTFCPMSRPVPSTSDNKTLTLGGSQSLPSVRTALFLLGHRCSMKLPECNVVLCLRAIQILLIGYALTSFPLLFMRCWTAFTGHICMRIYIHGQIYDIIDNSCSYVGRNFPILLSLQLHYCCLYR